MRGNPTQFLEEDLQEVDEETALTRRMKFVKTSREHLKKRWITEYLHALEERSRVQRSKEEVLPQIGAVVMITDNSKIKQNWRIGRIIGNIVGKDGVIRGYRLKTGRGFVVERPLQLVCDLEIGSVPDREPAQSEPEVESDRGPVEIGDIGTQRLAPRRAKLEGRDRINGVSLSEEEVLSPY